MSLHDEFGGDAEEDPVYGLTPLEINAVRGICRDAVREAISAKPDDVETRGKIFAAMGLLAQLAGVGDPRFDINRYPEGIGFKLGKRP